MNKGFQFKFDIVSWVIGFVAGAVFTSLIGHL